MNTKTKTFNLVRGTGLGPKVNQHANVFAHKNTKRNRDRNSMRRKAIDESKG